MSTKPKHPVCELKLRQSTLVTANGWIKFIVEDLDDGDIGIHSIEEGNINEDSIMILSREEADMLVHAILKMIGG